MVWEDLWIGNKVDAFHSENNAFNNYKLKDKIKSLFVRAVLAS